MTTNKIFITLVFALSFTSIIGNAQDNPNKNTTLTSEQQSLVAIAASTATGDLSTLKAELIRGLEAGLTVNQIREAIVHLYAYAGFPRSIRGLQTFITVLDERKAKGINDVMRSEEHTSELQSLMRTSSAVFCLK